MKKALILDDHKVFAESLATLLERSLRFNFVKTFSEEKEFIHYFLREEKREQIVFLDFYLKNGYSLHLIDEIKRIDKKTKVIIISSVINPTLIKSILDCKPDGFVSKSAGIEVLMDCINSLVKNKTYVCPETSEILSSSNLDRKITFTPKELELLNYFKKGYSIAETADLVFLSRHTIVSHRRKMMAKTKSKSVTELLHFAQKNGYLE